MCYFSSFELFLLVGGEYALFVFFCVSHCCLAERCYFSSLGLVLGGLRKDRIFFMTLFFGILESWTFCVFF